MIGEDSIRVFYERADCILKYRDKVKTKKEIIAKDIIRLEMEHSKCAAKDRELFYQYKILVEAIELVESLFKKKSTEK
jgi:hypothetical protein